jgi:predicted RNA-binding Zn-ribbon protein involved in translation (DUF1610 family)
MSYRSPRISRRGRLYGGTFCWTRCFAGSAMRDMETSMQPEIEFRGLFKVDARRALVPGNWYLGFACESCGKDFAIVDEPTGTGEVKIMGDGAMQTQCPSCGASRTYEIGSMQVFQSTTGGMTSPA